jgi:hypothetical protein
MRRIVLRSATRPGLTRRDYCLAAGAADVVTMSSFVLSTIASSSPRSRSGTPNFARVWWKSFMNASHSAPEMSSSRCASSMVRVGLRAARRPANLLGDVVLETLGRDAVVRLVDSRVRVQPRVDHDPIDEVVDDDGDGVDASQPLVQRLRFPSRHRAFLASDRVRAHDFTPFPTARCAVGHAEHRRPSALVGTRFPAIRGSLGAGTGWADKQIQPSARTAGASCVAAWAAGLGLMALRRPVGRGIQLGQRADEMVASVAGDGRKPVGEDVAPSSFIHRQFLG